MILIISAPEDVHAQAVMRELARQAVQGVRILNFADFPMRMTVNMMLDNNGHSDFDLRFAGGPRADLRDVTAVWWRRPQGFGVPENVKDPVFRHFAMSEAATAFQGMWQASQALWVNNIVRDAAASHKPWQLALAKKVGLTIPETLITNNPDEARRFWAQHPGQVIYKPFTASYHAWRETRLLKPGEEQFAPAVQLAPVIFQRYVPAVADLRITVIGDRFFAAEAASHEAEYKVDVRMNNDILYKAHQLPAEIERKLLGFMRRLGLEYGAIDMRLTPDGEYVFLEVNPAGQFLYVELATGQPISAALAMHLAGGAAVNGEGEGFDYSAAGNEPAATNGQWEHVL
jgi:glutathione synthase/RimK-type ligase-like ATP-grasp enzyme